MPIERLAWLVSAVAAVVVLLCAPLPAGWGPFAAFSALTLSLLRATAGAMPPFVLGAVIVLASLQAWSGRGPEATDFLAALAGALATGALLFTQRKSVCAESSPR